MAMPAAPVLDGLACHGLDLSYFTGKVEGFLRYQEIPHRRVEMNLAGLRSAARATGLAQMPAIQLADGRWMSDSSPIIEAIDAWMGAPRVVPDDEALRFFSRLLEDYADEWLWRPALHYRWSYEPDARLMSTRIAAEMMTDLKLPLAVRRALILRRQRTKYVAGDGVTAATRAHVESVYTRNLAWLQAIFSVRPFLLGDRPTLADFGFFASMFRHFGLDPTPARIMRDTAPAVWEWVARMWNARRRALGARPLLGPDLPSDWWPFVRDVGACYVPYLQANAVAFGAGRRHFEVAIEAVVYRLPVHRYRVWCLERLQTLARSLSAAAMARVRPILTEAGLVPALLETHVVPSGFDPQRRAPFFTPETIWAGS